MLITIDTSDTRSPGMGATPSSHMTQAMTMGQTAHAMADDMQGGSGIQSPAHQEVQQDTRPPYDAVAAINGGAPPHWLLDAVGATKNASEALARISARSLPSSVSGLSSTEVQPDRTGIGIDTGPGPGPGPGPGSSSTDTPS